MTETHDEHETLGLGTSTEAPLCGCKDFTCYRIGAKISTLQNSTGKLLTRYIFKDEKESASMMTNCQDKCQNILWEV